MQVKNLKKEKNTVTFDVELTPEEFEKFVNDAYLRNRSRIQVPGFRKGKAPRKIVEGMYGAEFFHDDAYDEAANDAFKFAIDSEKIQNVGRPAVTDAKTTENVGALLTFKTDVYPDVKLGEYKGLKAEKPAVKVTEEDINSELERMQKQNSRMITVERKAENGDTVNINYCGKLDGKAFDGGTADNQDLVLGSNSFIPGFEEQLVGISANEDKDLDLTFPEDYFEKSLAGKKVVFFVHCNAVRKEELPALDDEFAKDNDFDTLQELKDDIKKRRTEAEEEQANNAFLDALVDQGIENMELDLPESMVEVQIDDQMREYARYMQAQGISLESYINMMGGDFNSFRDSCRPTARKQCLTEIFLNEVAKAENVEVSEADCKAECAIMAQTYNMKPEDVEAAVNMDDLKADMMRRRAMDIIRDSGVAEKPKAKKAAKTEEATAEKKPAAEKKTTAKKAPAKKETKE